MSDLLDLGENSIVDGGDFGFSFSAGEDGVVLIRRDGKVVTILRGAEAEKFLSQIEGYEFFDQQQRMARVTGKYKRGNERKAKKHDRNH